MYRKYYICLNSDGAQDNVMILELVMKWFYGKAKELGEHANSEEIHTRGSGRNQTLFPGGVGQTCLPLTKLAPLFKNAFD